MQADNIHNSGRIAKNTLVLYIRMIFLMFISIYTSRIVLNALGVEDYGIYNVVGGVVSMFTILSGSMSAAISRFITFELGRSSDLERLRTVFSTSVTVQVIIAVLVVILAEGVGVWFINNRMNIDPERLNAANLVFQLSLLSFAVNLLSIPYNASIIAHEKMSAFAYISIFEGVAKLSVAFLTASSPFDRLIFYAMLTCVVAVIVRILYSVYCRKYFDEVRFRFCFDKGLFREMFSFAGWNFIGNGLYIVNTQGINVLSNIFFGVTVNAARGVVGQVEHAVNQFVNNFTTAINPQITKSYAAGDKDYMYALVCKGAKYSYFMMLAFAVPVILEAETLLEVWLKNVPEYAPVFLRYATVCSMTTVLSNTLVTAMFATGDIRRYQIIVGAVGLMVFPLSWVFFKAGFEPQVAYSVYCGVYGILLFVRLWLMKDMIGMPVSMYIRSVILRIMPVTLIAFGMTWGVTELMEPGIWRLLITSAAGVSFVASAIWLTGLERSEKEFIIEKSRKFIFR